MSHPWDQPAPERISKPSAYALLPEDWVQLAPPCTPEHVFGLLHRPWSWPQEGPRPGKVLARWLDEHFDLGLPKVVAREASEDGSTKVVLELADGERIEAVHMPREVRNPRVTLCISSQVGCAMGCTFCATGTMGIRRNLSAGEIVGQVLAVLHALGPEKPHQITLVFMGMGEPLHNLDALHRAICIFTQARGLNISPRRITVSTSGLVPGIERLGKLSPRPWLAVSLNATTDEARSRIMPVNRAYPLARLRQALAEWPLDKGEKLTIEFVLLAGENDSLEDADRLADWMGELRRTHNLNLIPLNEHEAAGFRRPQESGLNAFVARLKARGCFVTVRKSRGSDIQGACGQLVKRVAE